MTFKKVYCGPLGPFPRHMMCVHAREIDDIRGMQHLYAQYYYNFLCFVCDL